MSRTQPNPSGLEPESTYRVYVRIVDGNLTSASGREVAIKLHRRR